MSNNFEIRVTDRVRIQISDELLPINNEIKELRDQINNRQINLNDKINVTINPAMWKTDTDRKFFGDNRTNPKIYLKSLKVQLDNLDQTIDVKKYIRSTLGGDVELWFDIISEDFNTFDEFSNIFLQYYWGDQIQGKIRENLFNGRYNDTFGTSREKYAMRKFSIAKQLDPPMTDKDIIKYISRHFEVEISNVIAIHEINQIDRLLEYLKRIDDIKRIKTRFGQHKETNKLTYNTNNIWKTSECYEKDMANEQNASSKIIRIRRHDGRNENYTSEKDKCYSTNRNRQCQNEQKPEWKRRYNYERSPRREYDDRKNYNGHENNYSNRRSEEETINETRGYGRNTRSPVRYQDKLEGTLDKDRKTVQFDEIAIVHDQPSNNQNFY